MNTLKKDWKPDNGIKHILLVCMISGCGTPELSIDTIVGRDWKLHMCFQWAEMVGVILLVLVFFVTDHNFFNIGES